MLRDVRVKFIAIAIESDHNKDYTNKNYTFSFNHSFDRKKLIYFSNKLIISII
jgi:hypothetical protein